MTIPKLASLVELKHKHNIYKLVKPINRITHVKLVMYVILGGQGQILPEQRISAYSLHFLSPTYFFFN